MTRHIAVLVLCAAALAGCRASARPVDMSAGFATLTAVAALPSATPTDTATPDAAAIERQLDSRGWLDRQQAATLLLERPDIPAPRRAEMLLRAVEAEAQEPVDDEPVEGSYLTASGLLRLSYTRAMGALGAEALETLRRAAAGEEGAARERAILALGFADDAQATAALRQLLSDSDDPDVRMLAAYLLGELGDEAAVPLLRQALEDGHSVYYEGRLTGGVWIYPVRGQAAAALTKLGLEVRRLEDGMFEVVE